MKRKRLPAEIFPEEPLESVGTWLAGPLFGPAGLSTVTLDRSGSEFWREYLSRQAGTTRIFVCSARYYGTRQKFLNLLLTARYTYAIILRMPHNEV